MPLKSGPVVLQPLRAAHRQALAPLVADADLWRWWPRNMTGVPWEQTFDWQLREHRARRWIVFTVFHDTLGAVGQTCFIDPRPARATIEIGGTWYTRTVWGTDVNAAAKLALLRHACACGAQRIELKTDALNTRSRAAIERLDANFEGVFRRHLQRPDGSWRDTAWYSILADEVPAIVAGLEARLARARPAG